MWLEERHGKNMNQNRLIDVQRNRLRHPRRQLPLLHHDVRGRHQGPGCEDNLKLQDIAELVQASMVTTPAAGAAPTPAD